MRNRTIVSMALWLALWVVPASAAAGGAQVTAMSGAGTALPGRIGSIFLNPAGAAGVTAPTAHVTFNLAGEAGGLQQLFAYAEPDAGYGAGVLGLVRSRTVTSYDQATSRTLFDTANAWTYVVAKELVPGSSGGLRLLYETRQSDEKDLTGFGYRLDAGFIQSLGSGLFAALSVDNALETAINWSDGSRDAYGRTFTGGVAYVWDDIAVALDVEGTPSGDEPTLHAGAAWRPGPFGLLGGARTLEGETSWSAGLTYGIGPWNIEYAYVEASQLHQAGVTWSY